MVKSLSSTFEWKGLEKVVKIQPSFLAHFQPSFTATGE
jgi:hypothetical protein